MNVFQMILACGSKPGFWIQRYSWRNMAAVVKSFGTLTARPPYHGDPDIIVDLFDIHTGQLVSADMRLSSAGTGQYDYFYPSPELEAIVTSSLAHPRTT